MSGKLNEDADKGTVFKMLFYEWERGIKLGLPVTVFKQLWAGWADL